MYPAIAVLTLGTALVRSGWFAAGSSGATSQVTTLRGETAEQQPITVSLNDRGQIVRLATRLTGTCGNGFPYSINWQPTSPAIRFRSRRHVVTATESKDQVWPGATSQTTASMTARVADDVVTGDARYEAIFEYRAGRRMSCDSGLVHWIARRGDTRGNIEPVSSFSFGRWAGYVWQGSVRSVQASWSVPRILAKSPPGIAGTWIGAQAPRAAGRTPAPAQQSGSGPLSTQALTGIPFIQVGVNEERDVPVRGAALDNYYAFWTDSVHRFQPIDLFRVQPGDQVTASLSLVNGTWRVRILDPTSGLRATLATPDEGSALFDQAEWTQEHVTEQRADAQIPYPRTSLVVFRQLKVNSSVPAAQELHSSWMSENGGYLAPAPVIDDSFVLRDTTLSPAGDRYLRIVSRLNSASERFYAVIEGATRPGPQIQSARLALASTCHTTVAELRGTRWPANVQTLTDTLAEQVQALIDQAETLPSSSSGFRAWVDGWLTQAYASGATGQAIRRALDLPSVGPN